MAFIVASGSSSSSSRSFVDVQGERCSSALCLRRTEHCASTTQTAKSVPRPHTLSVSSPPGGRVCVYLMHSFFSFLFFLELGSEQWLLTVLTLVCSLCVCVFHHWELSNCCTSVHRYWCFSSKPIFFIVYHVVFNRLIRRLRRRFCYVQSTKLQIFFWNCFCYNVLIFPYLFYWTDRVLNLRLVLYWLSNTAL